MLEGNFLCTLTQKWLRAYFDLPILITNISVRKIIDFSHCGSIPGENSSFKGWFEATSKFKTSLEVKFEASLSCTSLFSSFSWLGLMANAWPSEVKVRSQWIVLAPAFFAFKMALIVFSGASNGAARWAENNKLN